MADITHRQWTSVSIDIVIKPNDGVAVGRSIWDWTPHVIKEAVKIRRETSHGKLIMEWQLRRVLIHPGDDANELANRWNDAWGRL